jgi:hypothetical protein
MRGAEQDYTFRVYLGKRNGKRNSKRIRMRKELNQGIISTFHHAKAFGVFGLKENDINIRRITIRTRIKKSNASQEK